MKKIVYSSFFSVLIICLLAAGVSAATNSLIGKKVQAVVSVKVDGKQVKDAVVIDGTTYAPVRSFSEASGYSVKVSKGEVLLTTTETINRSEEEVVRELKIKNQLNILENNITFWKASLVGHEETAARARKSIEEAIDWNATKPADAPTMTTTGSQTKLIEAETAIDDLKAKIKAAEAEIKQLEAQLNN
ncbi:hypothetical protein KB559_11025 [Paenibacillus sp. Marseille-P2973]|uniref:hypothetical protein n=1 Tax=Paenibacillus sp. Marseille-P2973 TaxID=1871032 RepID=UPI001B36FBDF|nr:hypothetical protein [Paenibacillus sp. Marseille-P2973]MBQ4899369.1 hypothetical protein [Paenibacillus sp. Marseille-P2973]